jgi:hypothetical protein
MFSTSCTAYFLQKTFPVEAQADIFDTLVKEKLQNMSPKKLT